MKLNQNPQLRVEDFPEQESWITKLFTQLNPLFSSLNQILNLNLDFSTNIKSVTRDFTFNFEGTFRPISFLWPFTDDIPRDLRVISSNKGTEQDPVILLPAWSYDIATKQIQVTKLFEVGSGIISEVSGIYQFKVRVTV